MFVFKVTLKRLYRLNLNPFPVGFKNVSSWAAFVVFSYQAEIFFVESDSVGAIKAVAVGVVAGEYDEVFLNGIIAGYRFGSVNAEEVDAISVFV